MATFGERVKELRKSRGLTQRQMAIALSITERNYQRYEATESPSNENLLKMADFFDVSTDYLLGRSDDPDVITVDTQTQNILVDNRLSLEAKGLYMQLRYYAFGDKAKLPNENRFLKENQITKKEFDDIIKELESFGYIKIGNEADNRNSENFYIFQEIFKENER